VSADNIPDADPMFGQGTTDVYCLVQFGTPGQAWYHVDEGSTDTDTEASTPTYRSKTLFNIRNGHATWNMGIVATLPPEVTEMRVRILDADIFTNDDMLDEIRVNLRNRHAGTQEICSVLGEGGGKAQQQCRLRARIRNADLKNTTSSSSSRSTVVVVRRMRANQDSSTSPPTTINRPLRSVPAPIVSVPMRRPTGTTRSVVLRDVTGDGPLVLGKATLPAALQGLFWMSTQKSLMSFGGTGTDGAGMSSGTLLYNSRARARRPSYTIQVAGDRVWAMASKAKMDAADLSGLVYTFHFDAAVTQCQIQIQITPPLGLDTTVHVPEAIADFKMTRLAEGTTPFPGSTIWRRTSALFGKTLDSATYDLVQVLDMHGERLEPAWTICMAQIGPETRLHYRDRLHFGPEMDRTLEVVQTFQADLAHNGRQSSTIRLDPRTFETSVSI
jgi:hypothetical protein